MELIFTPNLFIFIRKKLHHKSLSEKNIVNICRKFGQILLLFMFSERISNLNSECYFKDQNLLLLTTMLGFHMFCTQMVLELKNVRAKYFRVVPEAVICSNNGKVQSRIVENLNLQIIYNLTVMINVTVWIIRITDELIRVRTYPSILGCMKFFSFFSQIRLIRTWGTSKNTRMNIVFV